MRIPRELKNRRGAVIDTNVLIYLLEDDLQFGAVSEFIIQLGSAFFMALSHHNVFTCFSYSKRVNCDYIYDHGHYSEAE